MRNSGRKEKRIFYNNRFLNIIIENERKGEFYDSRKSYKNS